MLGRHKARLMEESQRDYKMKQVRELQQEASYRGQGHWIHNGKDEPAKIEQAEELGGSGSRGSLQTCHASPYQSLLIYFTQKVSYSIFLL